MQTSARRLSSFFSGLLVLKSTRSHCHLSFRRGHISFASGSGREGLRDGLGANEVSRLPDQQTEALAAGGGAELGLPGSTGGLADDAKFCQGFAWHLQEGVRVFLNCWRSMPYGRRWRGSAPSRDEPG